MNEVTIGITTRHEISDRFLSAWETGQPQVAYIGFESRNYSFGTTLTLEALADFKGYDRRG